MAGEVVHPMGVDAGGKPIVNLASGANSTDSLMFSQVQVDGPLRPSAAIAETVPRPVGLSNQAALVSGTLFLTAIVLPANKVISSITFISANTGLGTGTHQWFALFDNSRVQLATTTDDTSATWASNTVKTLNISQVSGGASATFTTTYAGLYYLGVMVAATTVPTLQGMTTTAVVASLVPILSGTSSTALTTPPAFPSTAATITAGTKTLYGYVS